jgi:hypothetical protein
MPETIRACLKITSDPVVISLNNKHYLREHLPSGSFENLIDRPAILISLPVKPVAGPPDYHAVRFFVIAAGAAVISLPAKSIALPVNYIAVSQHVIAAGEAAIALG